MAQKDFYKILGVQENADAETIKKAYRRLAKENHPDAHPGDKNAEARFKEISEAYSVLSDPKKRQQYDQMRKFGFGFNGGRPGAGARGPGFDFDLSDLFGGLGRGGRRRTHRSADFNLDDFFGFGGLGDLFSQILEREEGFGPRRRGQTRGADIHVSLEVPFETAALGGRVVFSVEKEVACAVCGGTGSKSRKQPAVCPDCHGSGMISMAQGAFAVSRPCPRCLGTGRYIADPCQNCRGTGKVRGRKKYSVTIPPGTETGKKMRLKGQGNLGANGKNPGDLIVTIRVARHRFFRQKGLDIYCEVPIDAARARQGTKVKVKTIHGKTVVLTVPPQTNGTKTFRLKGMGIKKDGMQGDQFVRVTVVANQHQP
ncbi:MAG: molecular chaperone DnaJ [Calditrichaeota bacterium]|nr:MAG: molecular chaperone DnaJ [Calditrichota bacterium]